MANKADSAQIDTIVCADIFELCDSVGEATVDMVLCDLPYGTTALEWDSVIPFASMWEAFKRIIKPRGAIVLTASQPFTSRLVCSQIDLFRYELIWEKSNATGFLDANRKPMKKHENILVFAKSGPDYYPIMEVGDPYISKRHGHATYLFDKDLERTATYNNGTRYPKSILRFGDNQSEKIHPNQKPVDLFAYLIRTFTQPGQIVFDPCCGSGTTAMAARETSRHWICGDQSEEYVQRANARLAIPYTQSLFILD